MNNNFENEMETMEETIAAEVDEETNDSDGLVVYDEEGSSGSSLAKVVGGFAFFGALTAGVVVVGKKLLDKHNQKTKDALEAETGKRFKKIKTGRFKSAWVEDTDFIETAFDEDEDICNYVEED